MGRTYRAYLPEQDFLLPPRLGDWLPEDHLAYFVSDVVEQLDLSAIESVYEEEERGQPPYHPRMMTKVLIYGYCVGVFSSRRIQKKLSEDIGFRVLAAGNQPDFRTISDFRKQHLGALQGLFDQVLQIALQAGTMKLGRVVLDGSKVKALMVSTTLPRMCASGTSWLLRLRIFTEEDPPWQSWVVQRRSVSYFLGF